MENKKEIILEVTDLKAGYNGMSVLHGINFTVREGEILAILGSNGVGKSTTLRAITGAIKPMGGKVVYKGEDITGLPSHKLVVKGISMVPEGRMLFSGMTVEDNLLMGAYLEKDKAEIQETLKMVYERFPRLAERKTQIAGTLSGGEQQMLAMGRALMSKPKIIVMDEPSMGLSPIFVSNIFDIIQTIRETGTTVLLVEQNAKKALSIADRAYVLETGKISLSGKASDLINDASVKKAYLGE